MKKIKTIILLVVVFTSCSTYKPTNIRINRLSSTSQDLLPPVIRLDFTKLIKFDYNKLHSVKPFVYSQGIIDKQNYLDTLFSFLQKNKNYLILIDVYYKKKYYDALSINISLNTFLFSKGFDCSKLHIRTIKKIKSNNKDIEIIVTLTKKEKLPIRYYVRDPIYQQIINVYFDISIWYKYTKEDFYEKKKKRKIRRQQKNKIRQK